MQKTHSIITAFLLSVSLSPAIAQENDAEDPNIDVVSEGYRQAIAENGIISQQMEINDAILMLQREKDKADAVSALVDSLGYDAVITLPNGDVLDLSKTKAGQEAYIAAMQQEQQIIDASLALERKRVEAEVLSDPQVLEAMKRARETEVAESLVSQIGSDAVIETSDGRVIDLSETIAGKRQTISVLKVDAELLKARADLGNQENQILKVQADREAMERARMIEEARLERELRQNQQPTVPVRQMPVATQQPAPQADLIVHQIYGDGRALKANIMIDDIAFDIQVGDQLGSKGKIKKIDRTSVVIEADGRERKFFIY
ncbi:hypothetical protein [Pseudosulfitobacter pseudonitzschiae]|uniref:hypothetical protein n=1 Tax=Pseudosulfitobacter pseudonitzschiae TaxID=1402135 RepID=UPI003B7E1418